jgi:predicted nucleic acid-binding protein
MMQLVKNHGHIVKPTRCLAESIDPDDNKLIECADAAHADYLITGNLKHFPRNGRKHESSPLASSSIWSLRS